MNTKHLVLGACAVGFASSVSLSSAYAFEGMGKRMEKSSFLAGKMGNASCGMMKDSEGKGMGMMGGMNMGMGMSETMKSLMEELRAAQKSGDTTKIEAIREKIKAQRATEKTAHQAAMDAALAGGYETWKAFAEAQGMPKNMTEKITAENFPTLVELHNAKKKVMELEEKLGFPMMGHMENMRNMEKMGGMKKMEKMGRGKSLRGSGEMPYKMTR